MSEAINTDGLFVYEMDMKRVLVALKLAPSNTEANRMLKDGAVDLTIDGETHTAALKEWLPLNQQFLIKYGKKKFLGATITAPVPRVLVEDLPDAEDEITV